MDGRDARGALTSRGAAAHTRAVVGPSRGPAPNSTFRAVALVTSSVAAILFVLSAAAVVRYGDRIRVFGWMPAARAGGELAVWRVDQGGPASGILQPGDALVAWNVLT